jgi:hypothetical protein
MEELVDEVLGKLKLRLEWFDEEFTLLNIYESVFRWDGYFFCLWRKRDEDKWWIYVNYYIFFLFKKVTLGCCI